MVAVEFQQPAIPILSHNTVVLPKEIKVNGLRPTRLAIQTPMPFETKPSPIPRTRNTRLYCGDMPTTCR